MVYFTSDLHLDHYNIIRYCQRPFKTVQEMNAVLVENWNNTIQPDDTVYFLGDLAFGWRSHHPLYWLNRLNGHIIYIKGSHDNGIKASQLERIVIMGEEVLLLHNPADIPVNWDRWVIHGHTHNNSPFLDRTLKRINVSVEVTEYKPVSLSSIVSILTK